MRMKKYLVVLILLLIGCSNEPDHRASYIEVGGKFTISLELFHIHPYLAEYERELVILNNGKEQNRKRLFPDTGGYTSTNIYRCNPNKFFIKGYFDSWVVDLEKSSIIKGSCNQKSQLFIGAFHGAGSQTWKFYPASERNEELLKAKGG